jgi:hypothetical protein
MPQLKLLEATDWHDWHDYLVDSLCALPAEERLEIAVCALKHRSMRLSGLTPIELFRISEHLRDLADALEFGIEREVMRIS